MSPRDQTNVNSPYPGWVSFGPGCLLYAFRVGLRSEHGTSLSLGTRIDGIPIHDLVGGNDGFRRPGYSLYLEPGVIMKMGHTASSLGVPMRVHQNFKRSLVDLQLNQSGGGDLADSLIIAQYSWRF